MAKRTKRVHVECATSHEFRWLNRSVRNDVPPTGQINADGSITVLRPDRFRIMLQASGCYVTETLNGAGKRSRSGRKE